MVNTEDDKNSTAAELGTRRSATLNVEVQKPQLTDISKYFVKDILNILEDSSMKGKTKLKQVRKRMYEYLK